jgi:hypothetical protein
MMLGLHGSGLASTTRVFGRGCGTWGLVGGGRVGTLLGPEASGPPARALRRGWWGSGGSGSSLCPVRCLLVVCGGLVGLLFEICIVDASIN